MTRTSTRIGIGMSLMLFGGTMRLLPHLPNVTPLTAIALLSGSVLPRKLSLWVPVLTMIVSDAFIGFYGPTMFITWGCFAVIALTSSLWFRQPRLGRGILLCCAASVFFYLVTNFAVWVFSGMYAHSWSGLAVCYEVALPFFRNMILGDLFFCGFLYGCYAYVQSRRHLDLQPVKTSVKLRQTNHA